MRISSWQIVSWSFFLSIVVVIHSPLSAYVVNLSRRLSPGNELYRPSTQQHRQWSAPECIRSESPEVTIASDIFSFGITLMELFTFAQLPLLHETQPHGQSPCSSNCIPAFVPDAIRSLIVDCLNFNARNRPSAKSLIERLDKLEPQFPSQIKFLYRKIWVYSEITKKRETYCAIVFGEDKQQPHSSWRTHCTTTMTYLLQKHLHSNRGLERNRK
jgi:serine/threonine protein kinase